MAWLTIQEGQTIQLTISITSIKAVTKHWAAGRSHLCTGNTCPFCLKSIAKRQRYQAQVVVATTPYTWEFGELTMADITATGQSTWARLTITRLGAGPDTRYQVRSETTAPTLPLPHDEPWQDPERVLALNPLARRKHATDTTETKEG